jgi:hypothetical protein
MVDGGLLQNKLGVVHHKVAIKLLERLELDYLLLERKGARFYYTAWGITRTASNGSPPKPRRGWVKATTDLARE